MHILVTGGTGFIGSALCLQLCRAGHSIVVLTRNPARISPPITAIDTITRLGSRPVDLVVNLAGEPIADKRWSNAQKQRIISSRVAVTRALIAHFAHTGHRPEACISASAIGYYGLGSDDQPIDEHGLPDNSFSSQLCQQWEAAAMQAADQGIRTCILRIGIVLGRGGGALHKMLPLFKLGLGGKIATGEQWMSWIHLDDLVAMILHCMTDQSMTGTVNATSPNPVTNAEFARTLGRCLARPAFCTTPAVAVRLLMGEMGKELLLSGKRIIPQRMLDAGYTFTHPLLDGALTDIVGNR